MILSLDTAGPVLKVALLSADSTEVDPADGRSEVARREIELGRTMARRILAELHDFLVANNLEFEDLTGIRVNTGPGSYTGLRIGLTAANTLADALQIPINGKKPPVLPRYENN